MLILISQRNDPNKHGDLIDNLENNYISYLEKFGITLLIIPNTTNDVNYYFNKFPIEGVILSGGNDINPEMYGEKGSEKLALAPERDKIERKILELAIEKSLPILGICRGMQFINAYFGGRLTKVNQEGSHPPRRDHLLTMTNEKAKNSLGTEAQVNSYHSQGIFREQLAPKLKVFAILEKENIIEGLYHPDLPIAGIQWHPERESPDEEFNEKLIKAFIDRRLFWEEK